MNCNWAGFDVLNLRLLCVVSVSGAMWLIDPLVSWLIHTVNKLLMVVGWKLPGLLARGLDSSSHRPSYAAAWASSQHRNSTLLKFQEGESRNH